MCKFTKAFITFNSEDGCNNSVRFSIKNKGGLLGNSNSDDEILDCFPIFKRAPNPMNINWEYLNNSNLKVTLRTILCVILTIGVITAGAFLIGFLD